jgi:hypothetical protein
VESVREAGTELNEFDPAPDRQKVCGQCVCLGSCRCPCPAAQLSALLVRAVRSVEERCAQRDLLRRRLPVPGLKARRPAAELIRAYEAATMTCVGCD